MKKQLLFALSAIVAICVLPACTTVVEEDTPRTTSTTTTESTSVRSAPMSGSTTTVRSY